MNITFTKLDEDIPLINEPARKIVIFLLEEDTKVINIFSDVLLVYSKYNDTKFVNKMVERIDVYKEMYPELSSKIDILKDLMWDYFSFIDDVKFDLLVKSNNKYYNSVNSQQKKLDKLRGTLFELLIEEIIRPKFENGEFNTGCMVSVNGHAIISNFQSKQRKTIDIAGYRQNNGEFYECKLSPKSLSEKDYYYLYVLDQHLKDIRDFRYIIGCFSLGEKLALENKKIQIEKSLGIIINDIIFCGFDGILQLKKSLYASVI